MRNKKIFLLPIIGVITFYVLPLIYSLILSVDGYAQLLNARSFYLGARNTLFSVLLMVGPLFCLSMGIALVLNQAMDNAKKWWINTMFVHMLPYIIPSAIVTFVVSSLWGMEGTSWWILFFIYLWKNYGYCMIILLGGIRKVPIDSIESAQLEGAEKWQLLFYIILPQIRYFVLFCIIIAIMNVFKLYREMYLLYGDYPGETIYSIQHYINNCFYSMGYEKVAAVAVLLSIVLGGTIWGLYGSGLKEEDFV